jgi:hypothetical protein
MTMGRWAGPLACAALVGWAACGGIAVVDGQAPVGGAGGSGAATTSGGSNQGGTTTGTATGTGTGTGAGGCGPNVTCPQVVPTHGSGCSCEAGLKCAYDLCDDSGDTLGATCDGTSWTVESDVCSPLYCLNGMICGDNEVCLMVNTGFAVEFLCAPNPCATQPLDCECASALCMEHFACTVAGAGQVTCECTIC